MADRPANKDLVQILRTILKDFIAGMSATFQRAAETYAQTDDEIANELRFAAEVFPGQAKDAIELIQQGELTLPVLRRVLGTLYLTNITLRWVLEQQTTTYHAILDAAPGDLGKKIEAARMQIEAGDQEEGFKNLIGLVSDHRESYPLLMTTGFVYLKHKKNLAYAMRYFEKAAKNPPRQESNHYRSLALHFLATCHEGQKHYRNALNTLLLAVRKRIADAPLQYSIARLYAYLGEHESAINYFEQAVRSHPAFYAMAVIDPAFESIHEQLIERLRSFNARFRTLGATFEEQLEEILRVVERYELDDVSKEVRREVQRVASLQAMVGKRCYSGYRSAITRFFVGSFPEVLHTLQAALIRRQKQALKELQELQALALKRRKRLRLLLLPTVSLGAAALIYIFEGRLLDQLPVSFPFIDFVLPLVGIGFAVWIVLAAFGGRGTAGMREQIEIRAMETDRRSLAEREKQLAAFWKDEVALQVSDVPVWLEEEMAGRGVL